MYSTRSAASVLRMGVVFDTKCDAMSMDGEGVGTRGLTMLKKGDAIGTRCGVGFKDWVAC